MIKRGKRMLHHDSWMPPTAKPFVSAHAPFPRSTWIHPHVPGDHFDRVCREIWRRTMWVKEELDRCQRPSEAQQNKECQAPLNQTSHRAEEQQRQTDAVGLSTQCEDNKQQYHTDFTLPCPYLSGRSHPHVVEPVRVLSPVMEEKIKPNKEAAEGKRNLEKYTEDKRRSFENIPFPQSGSRSVALVLPFTAGTKLEPPLTNPLCPSTLDHTPLLSDEYDPPARPSEQLRDTCASEDEQDTRSSSDSSSSDDEDCVVLPGLRSCATNSSGDDAVTDISDSEVEKHERSRSPDELSLDSRQDSPSSSSEEDFPALCTIKTGMLPRPTVAPTSGKMQGQWEIPFSFSIHSHIIPTATLENGVTAPAQAPVQGKAEVHQAKVKTSSTPAVPTQQEAYDLLADFPALQPPKKPLALGILRNGIPKTKEWKRGLTHSPNHRQESGASHQRRMENVPHEVSSICAGDQKSVQDLQTFGPTSQTNSTTISCEILKANNLPLPRVAGTDGVGVNARSWASAAKAGMKQAAAPQEKARPCTFQQIVTINRAKVPHNIPYRATPSHQAAGPLVNAWSRGPRPRNPNRFVRPGFPPAHQHFGAQVHRANCPPGIRCPRFPFQQARGNHSKRGYV